ncbi:MAG: asparagine synthetase B, partial [Deltaproteobacteria bacterium]
MTERLHHRGPDGAGVEVLPDERGVFAHTRLAIIDLSERGRQPFVSDDGRVVLSFNGEIYNFLDLRQRLQQRGFRFRSDCDTEVILAQYLEHGAAGLDALDGMFAFAIYDARDDRLLLMRDRAGKKPLYWTRTSDGALVFGSEVKALAEHPGVTIRPNADALPALLAYGYAPTPTSMFAGIHKLEPASRLTFTRGDVSIHRYWSLDQAAAEATPMSLEDAKTRVRLAVGEAVERRLISDVPLGAFLSG